MENKKYCNFVYSSLAFHQTNVRLCSTTNIGPILSEYNEKNEEIANKIINLRQQNIDNFEEGIIHPNCHNCLYKENEDIINGKISRIDFFHWYHCNCGCFYCAYRDCTHGKFSDDVLSGKPYILNIIKKLYSKNIIDTKNLIVVFGGGEVTVLKEFAPLVNLFLKNNVKFISVDSSGIKYSKTIEKILKNGTGQLVVAPCAGSKELYKKIKNRDKYSQVMKNLKKYVDEAKFKNSVISKFIILENMNNNTEEINRWLLECNKIGIKKVEICIEFCWGKRTKKGIPIEDYNYTLFDYTEKKCKELNIELLKNSTSVALMKDGKY